MKNYLVNDVISTDAALNVAASLTSIEQEFAEFAFGLDDAQRKHSLRIGIRNETFCREMMELARERPHLVPFGINLANLDRAVAAREQLTPILFRLRTLTRQVEDTHIALGVDVYNGTRALYKAVKPLALINGIADVVARIGQRFAGQGRRKPQPQAASVAANPL